MEGKAGKEEEEEEEEEGGLQEHFLFARHNFCDACQRGEEGRSEGRAARNALRFLLRARE